MEKTFFDVKLDKDRHRDSLSLPVIMGVQRLHRLHFFGQPSCLPVFFPTSTRPLSHAAVPSSVASRRHCRCDSPLRWILIPALSHRRRLHLQLLECSVNAYGWVGMHCISTGCHLVSVSMRACVPAIWCFSESNTQKPVFAFWLSAVCH